MTKTPKKNVNFSSVFIKTLYEVPNNIVNCVISPDAYRAEKEPHIRGTPDVC